ncbi:hypothetical protein D3C78_1805600 [compost metagenome]
MLKSGIRDSQHVSAARFNLFNVAKRFFIQPLLRHQSNYRHAVFDQCQGAMLQLARSVSLRVNVRNFL